MSVQIEEKIYFLVSKLIFVLHGGSGLIEKKKKMFIMAVQGCLLENT